MARDSETEAALLHPVFERSGKLNFVFYIAKYSLNRVFIIATTDNETLCRSGDWPAVSRLADNILKSINMQCHQNTKALLLYPTENKGYIPLPGLSYICVIYK